MGVLPLPVATNQTPSANQKSGDTMDEQRKHAILFAAALLCARKLLPLMETDEPKPAQELLTEHVRWRAVEQAHRLLEIIDTRWPAKMGEAEK